MRPDAAKLIQDGIVIPALPLVLHADRSFDEARQRRLIRYYLAAGVGGIAVAVHTTQFAIRDPKINLFDRIIKVAKDEIEKYEKKHHKTIVSICGVCGLAEQACLEAEKAKAAGYDAVLLSPNGLQDLAEEQLLERTRLVAKIMPVIGFYLQSAAGGRKLSYDYWHKLCQIDGLIAVKAAPFNRYQTLEVARAIANSDRDNEISLYTGNDDNILIDLLTTFQFPEGKEVSVKGGLLGHWAVWTRSAVQLLEQVKEIKKAASLQLESLSLAAKITDSNAAFFDAHQNFAGCIVGIHEILRRQGLLEGVWTLDENEVLTDFQKSEIDRVLESYPELADDAFVKEFLAQDAIENGKID